MHKFVDPEDEADYGGLPHTVQRHCTDVPCCLIFLLCLAAFGYVTAFGVLEGDPQRFLHLPNSEMERCGVSAGVEDKPFLYFCQGSSGLSPQNTICVSTCPTNPVAVPSTLCPAGMTVGYPTRAMAGVLCMPTDAVQAMQLEEALGSPNLRHAIEIAEVLKNWKAIAIVAGVAIILGFFFLFFLETCAYVIFWGSVTFVILVFASLGGYMIYGAQLREAASHHSMTKGATLPELSTGDVHKDFVIGIAACLVAFVFLCFACCSSGVVNRALESLKEAADCMTDIPSLLVQPFIDLAIKISLFVLLVVGFWYLVSTAQMQHSENRLGQYEIKYQYKEYFFMAFYVFMAYWILSMADAMSSFVIAYAVEQWYSVTRGGLEDSSEAPCCPTLQGLCAGISYHLGTFAFGSCIIAFVSWLRDIMFMLTKQAADSGNQVMVCCGACCTCCLSCFNSFLKYMTKNAYMDTAMNSNAFCKAAHHSVMVLTEHAGEVATLNTTTILFTIAGVSGIAAIGVLVMHLLCTYWPMLSDPESPDYVENRVSLYAVTAVICVLVSIPFMMMLDQVADTILYCLCIEKKRTPPPQQYLEEPEGAESGALCSCCYGPTSPPKLTADRRALING